MLQRVFEDDFEQMYEIMEMSFPTDEHRPYGEQKALFRNKIYRVYGIYDDNSLTFESKRLKAFLAVWDLGNITFIEHFAVNPIYRNSGIGAAMLQELKQFTGNRLCLEVEPPEDELTRRRIAFYERNGFIYHDFAYMQPVLSKGQNTIPLKIMTTGDKLDKTAFEEIKELLYSQVYGS